MKYILALDQGTTSSRAILFDEEGKPVSVAQREIQQIFPQAGWVEHDPEEIWRAVQQVCRDAMAKRPAGGVRAIGITNQRETTVVWNRKTGKAIHNAIVWQDRRGAPLCRKLIEEGWEPKIQAKTGLLIDSYFSATKVRWFLDNVPGAQAAAERGELAMGTIDSFLLWRLTGGKVHATDVTNASRTMLFNIHTMDWDEELLELFKIPKSMLPKVLECADEFGTSAKEAIGATLPIAGIAGDQQAALIGQACFAPGMTKSTYGTGCFMLLNTGRKAVASTRGLLTTPAYRIGGETAYALEGSIFVAGAAVKWLRDGLGVITDAAETESMATRVPDSHGVTIVPAFTGLGAPYWDPDARGAIFGLTLDTTGTHLARAALEAVAYQSLDLIEAVAADYPSGASAMRIDGGMAANRWLCQFLADILQVPIERPRNLETTALGAAFLAGLATGVWGNTEEVEATWARQDCFEPKMDAARRNRLLKDWEDAVARTLSHAPR